MHRSPQSNVVEPRRPFQRNRIWAWRTDQSGARQGVDRKACVRYDSSRREHEGAAGLRNQDIQPYKDDESLIQAYLAGETLTVDLVTDLIENVVRRFPYLRGEKDDIIQEVHRRVLQNLKAGRFHRRCPFQNYVARISLNVCIDLARHARQVGPVVDPATKPDPEARTESALDRLIRKEQAAGVLWCLEQIPKQCRDILRLRFWEEKRHREIAALAGIMESTSRVRLKRCLSAFADLFQKWQEAKR